MDNSHSVSIDSMFGNETKLSDMAVYDGKAYSRIADIDNTYKKLSSKPREVVERYLRLNKNQPLLYKIFNPEISRNIIAAEFVLEDKK